MSKMVNFSDGIGSVGGFYATIELDSRERVFIQLAKKRNTAFVKISTSRFGGMLLSPTLFEDAQIMVDFAARSPEGMSPANRSRELLRRLSTVVMDCGSTALVEQRFRGFSAADLF